MSDAASVKIDNFDKKHFATLVGKLDDLGFVMFCKSRRHDLIETYIMEDELLICDIAEIHTELFAVCNDCEIEILTYTLNE